jgi:hypothetical protein
VGFLATLHTSPGIALWLKVQAAGSLRDSVRRIFCRSTFVNCILSSIIRSVTPRKTRWAYENVSVYIAEAGTSMFALHDSVTKWEQSAGTNRIIFRPRQFQDCDLRVVCPKVSSSLRPPYADATYIVSTKAEFITNRSLCSYILTSELSA